MSRETSGRACRLLRVAIVSLVVVGAFAFGRLGSWDALSFAISRCAREPSLAPLPANPPPSLCWQTTMQTTLCVCVNCCVDGLSIANNASWLGPLPGRLSGVQAKMDGGKKVAFKKGRAFVTNLEHNMVNNVFHFASQALPAMLLNHSFAYCFFLMPERVGSDSFYSFFANLVCPSAVVSFSKPSRPACFEELELAGEARGIFDNAAQVEEFRRRFVSKLKLKPVTPSGCLIAPRGDRGWTNQSAIDAVLKKAIISSFLFFFFFGK